MNETTLNYSATAEYDLSGLFTMANAGGNGGVNPNMLVIPEAEWVKEGTLQAQEVENLEGEIRRLWNVGDDQTWTLLRVRLLSYFALNQTSSKASYGGYYDVGGNRYELRDVAQALTAAGVRKYARSTTTYYDAMGRAREGTIADAIRQVLLANPKMAQKCAAKYGVDARWGPLCFDVAEFCTNLTPPEVAFTRRQSKKILSGIEDVDVARDGDDVGHEPRFDGY